MFGKPLFNKLRMGAVFFVFLFGLSFMLSTRAAAFEEWYEYYFQAEYAYRQGDFVACAARAELAFDRNTQSGTYAVKGTVVEYYPHWLLCQCYSQLHETEKAKCHCAAGVNDEKFEPCTCQCDLPSKTVSNAVRVESTTDRKNFEEFALKRKIQDIKNSGGQNDIVTTTYSGGSYEVPLTINKSQNSAASSSLAKKTSGENDTVHTTLSIDQAGTGTGKAETTLSDRLKVKRKTATSLKNADKESDTTATTTTAATTSRRYTARESSASTDSETTADSKKPAVEENETDVAAAAERKRHLESSTEAVALASSIRTDMSRETEEKKKKSKIKDAITIVAGAAILYGAIKLDQKEKAKINREDPGGPKILDFAAAYKTKKEYPEMQKAYMVGIGYEFSPYGQPVENVYINNRLVCTTKRNDPVYKRNCNGPEIMYDQTDYYGVANLVLLGVDKNGKSASKTFTLFLPRPGE